MAQQAARTVPKQQQPRDRARGRAGVAFHHEAQSAQAFVPRRFILRRARFSHDRGEVVCQAFPTEMGKAAARNRQHVRMQQTACGEQPRLLLPRGQPRGAADAHVDVFAAALPDHVRLDGTLRDRDDGDAAIGGDRHLFVERQQQRMDHVAEHRVHDPSLQARAANPGNRPVVLHAQQHASSLEVGQRCHLSRQLLGPQFVPLELDAGVLPRIDQFQELLSGHPRSPPVKRPPTTSPTTPGG